MSTAPPAGALPCNRFHNQEEALYQGLRADQPDAWECLYTQVYASFVPYAAQRSALSTDDLLDLLHEGMAEFIIKLKDGRYAFQGKPVAGYAFVVCRNLWASFLRKNKVQPLDTQWHRLTDDDADSPAYAPGGWTHPDDELAGAGTPNEPGDPIWGDPDSPDLDALRRSLDELDPTCRQMMICFYVEEKSLAECGARLNIRETSAKVKRFRCAQRLKTLYFTYKQD